MDKGSKVDTSGLEEATKQATAILQQNYEQTRGDVSPWYNIGVSGVNALADALGIGGGSVQSRDQVYQELLPQYTTTQTTGGGGYTTTRDGQLINVADRGDYLTGLIPQGVNDLTNKQELAQSFLKTGNVDKAADILGVNFNPAQTTTSTVDQDALNAAIDARMNAPTPEGYGRLLETFDASKMQDDEGYQFRQDEAQKALERQLAAQGVTLGGGGYGEVNPQAVKYMQDLSQGLASQEYQNAYNRYVNDQMNTYNMLAGVSGMGQAATNTMAAAGQNMASGTAGLTTDLASAQLNAQMANASRPSMFSTLLGGAAQAAGAYFSDRRLKDNIEHVGVENGHNIYEFDYKDGSGRYRGVMADEVKEIEPDAVHVHSNGYMMVNYDKLGLKMERV